MSYSEKNTSEYWIEIGQICTQVIFDRDTTLKDEGNGGLSYRVGVFWVGVFCVKRKYDAKRIAPDTINLKSAIQDLHENDINAAIYMP